MHNLPFITTIKSMKDFLTFEREIRILLGCDSTYCSLFQTADYVELKMLIRKHLSLVRKGAQRSSSSCSSDNSAAITTIYIAKTNYSISLLEDCQTLVVRLSDLPPIVTRSSAAEEDDFQDVHSTTATVDDTQQQPPPTKKTKVAAAHCQDVLFDKFANKLFSSRCT